MWSAGQGAICQFVNDEALGEPAAFDQFIQGITNGQSATLYGTTCVGNQGGSAFNFGAAFGRGTSYAISVVEIVGSVDMIVGGGVGGAVTCPVTFGGGCVAGAGAVAVGAAGVVHGGAVLVRNLNAPIMRAQGKGNADNGEQIYVVRNQETGEVVYVGRTRRSISQRELEHQVKPGREKWKLERVMSGLSNDEARYWGQTLIDQYGGVAKLENKIRAVAPGKWEMLKALFE